MISVTVPAFNAQDTIEPCLQAIRASSYPEYELIVVDDGSTDRTGEVAARYADKVIAFIENKGLIFARETALKAASGDIAINIDSDVLIKPDTLDKIDDYFKRNPVVDALTGQLSKEHLHKNYFSQYKNLYMNYIFSKQPERVSFLYGSIFAIRRELVDFYKSTATITDDTEFGQRLFTEGKIIVLLKELKVIHLKKYNFRSWIKNDFWIPFQWTSIFVSNKGWKQLGRNGTGFSHASIKQLINVVTAPTIVLVAILTGYFNGLFPALVGLVTIWIFLNIDFFRFLRAERGAVFGLVAAPPVTFLDHLAMFTGIFCGFLYRLFGNRDRTVISKEHVTNNGQT